VDSSLVGTSISIDEYLRERRLKEVFDGPLTDYEYSDSEGSPPTAGHQQQAPCSSTWPDAAPPAESLPAETSPAEMPRKHKERLRKATSRRNKRAAAAADSDSDCKQVVKKRRAEAAKEALQLPFSMHMDVEVTKPAWLGKRFTDMPKQLYTKEELTQMPTYGMVCFPWDGRCVSIVPRAFFFQLLNEHSGKPTPSLIGRGAS
jgi:hypothetical protein